MLKTAIVTDRAYLAHFAGRSHPERPERLAALLTMAEQLSRDKLIRIAPRAATRDEIALAHREDYVDAVVGSAEFDHFDFDADTHTCRESYQTAMLSAGGVLTAMEAVLDGAADNAFAMVRPPGHHARPDRAMGFCLFNNVAIAAKWAIKRRGLERVAIIDWDVHHGNGTQEIFYESPEVLYVSTHQYPHYPGTGSTREIGAGAGLGYIVNAPMPAGFGDDEYILVFDELVMPIVRKFRPELIIVSAGFDSHYRDPLGDMRVTERGFAAMTRRVKRLAAEVCGGRIVAALEGGYDLEGLTRSASAVIEELGRDSDEEIAAASGGERAGELVARVAQGVGRFWDLG